MTKIIWSQPAVSDLEKLHDYIAKDSVVYADAFILKILNAVDQLAHFPKSGRVVPEIHQEHTRELIVGHYRIVYDIVGPALYRSGAGHRPRSDWSGAGQAP